MTSNPSPRALICDIDGTITDERRRISTDAVLTLRTLIDNGIPVVLASGNTVCSLDMLSKMIGTEGNIIAENGGVYRIGFGGKPQICGDRAACWDAYLFLRDHYSSHGEELVLYSPEYRFADVAFARSVDPAEVKALLSDWDIQIIDTGFAIHLLPEGINKGTAFAVMAPGLGFAPEDFAAVGDSDNDIEMIRTAGVGVALGNATPRMKESADLVTEKKYGEGFSTVIRTLFPDYFFDI
jgi:phosphoglycolate phosphatase (TIGR01487 family)